MNKSFSSIIQDSVFFLEHNLTCEKHHVEHTGSIAYLLDFYDYLDEVERGKKLVRHLLDLIVTSPEGARVFYPGHLNPMNMSQNVIDTGTAVDVIARFARRNYEAFTEAEHDRIRLSLKDVVDSYLVEAASNKKVTNQRLWGLTGLASYARYVGKESRYIPTAHESIEQAFTDMTKDGFFRYSPNPSSHLTPYDGITAFYQSRHTAFIAYTLSILGMDFAPYQERLEVSIKALLSMYTENGWKDLRMESKRWYWLGPYEVASHSFDAYALSLSRHPIAKAALHNVLYQIGEHFFDGFLHSHKGPNLDFQCPIFWTAHLAWLTRIEGIGQLFNGVTAPVPFEYTFKGKELFTKTSESDRTLVNARWQKRNPTTGILTNGLKGKCFWAFKFPDIPHAYAFSIREVLNHSWYALRGGRVLEAFMRPWRFTALSIAAVLPRYCVSSGRIVSFEYGDDVLTVEVIPASRFGTELAERHTVTVPL